MNLYEVKIFHFDDFDNKEKNFQGYIVAENYSNALKELAQYFGEDNLLKVEISWISDNRIIAIPNTFSLDSITKENITV